MNKEMYAFTLVFALLALGMSMASPIHLVGLGTYGSSPVYMRPVTPIKMVPVNSGGQSGSIVSAPSVPSVSTTPKPTEPLNASGSRNTFEPRKPVERIHPIQSTGNNSILEVEYTCYNCSTPINIPLGNGTYTLQRMVINYNLAENDCEYVSPMYRDSLGNFFYIVPDTGYVVMCPTQNTTVINNIQNVSTNYIRIVPNDPSKGPIKFNMLDVKVYWKDEPPIATGYSSFPTCSRRNITLDFDVSDSDSNISQINIIMDNSTLLNRSFNTPKLHFNFTHEVVNPGYHMFNINITDEYGASWWRTTAWFVKPSPDFYVRNVSVYSTDNAHPVNVSMVVGNNGDSLNGTYYGANMAMIVLYVNGAIKKVLQDVRLDAGQTKDITTSLNVSTPGNYTLTVRILNQIIDTCSDLNTSNNVFSTHFNVIQANRPPRADFYWTPSQIVANRTPVVFYDNSTDPDNNIVKWVWNFGDGITVYMTNGNHTSNITHVFTQPGTFYVNLTVVDSGGLKNSTVKPVNVLGLPVINEFKATPSSGYDPLTVEFTVNVTDPNNINSSNLSVTVFYGDGKSVSTLVSGATGVIYLNHTYEYMGNYTARLVVNDGYGLSTNASTLVRVSDAAPVITDFEATPQNGSAPLTVNFCLSAYDANDNELTGTLYYGNGNKLEFVLKNTSYSTLTCYAINYTYSKPGSYNAMFVVKDRDGLEDYDIRPINVTQVELPDLTIPSVNISSSINETEPVNITVYVKNQGNANATNVEVRMTQAFSAMTRVAAMSSTASNSTTGNVKYVNVSAGETVPVVFTWVPGVYGNYTLYFDVDPVNVVHESNESNNEYTLHVHVNPLPDFAVYPDLITSEGLTQGQPGNVSVQVLNIGHTGGNVSVTLSYTGFNSTLNKSVYIPAGHEQELTFQITPVSVNTTVNVSLMGGDELNYSNDFATKNLSVKPSYPELEITNVSVSASETSAILLFNTTNKANVTVYYGNSTNYTSEFYDNSSSMHHAFNITGLVPNSTYYFEIDAIGVYGQTASYNGSFTTLANTTRLLDVAVASLELPSSARVGEPFNITAIFSNDGNTNVTTLAQILINGTVIFSDNITLGVYTNKTVHITYIPNETGQYTITAVIDPDNALNEINETNNEITKTINVTELQPPVAVIPPETWVKVGENATFNASNSYDPDGTIVSYAWNFGDGTNGTGKVTYHAYNSTGLYIVSLTVTDNDGLTSRARELVAVWNDTGLPDFIPYVNSTSVVAGELNEIQVWIYNVGNVSSNVTSFVLMTYGNSSVNLTKTVFIGAVNKTVVPINITLPENATDFILNITVNPGHSVNESNYSNDELVVNFTVLHRPVAKFSAEPSSGYAPLNVLFNASNSYDPDGTIVSYAWNFGDGTNGTGKVVSHRYSKAGTYTVTLTVTDNDNLTSEVSSTIKVSTRPSGGGGGAGGGGGFVIHINPNPPQKKPSSVTKPKLVSYYAGHLFVVRGYNYDANSNETTITTVVRGTGNVTLYQIIDTIPKSIAKNITMISISPTPDKVIKADPVVSWMVGLGAGQTFTFKYTIHGHVPIGKVAALQAPKVKVISSVYVKPKPKNNTTAPVNTTNGTVSHNATISPITGLVTFAQGNIKSLLIVLLLAIFIALVAVYFDVVDKVRNVTTSVAPSEEIREVSISEESDRDIVSIIERSVLGPGTQESEKEHSEPETPRDNLSDY